MTRLDKIEFMNKWCLESPACYEAPEKCLCRLSFVDGSGCVPFEKRTDKELDEAFEKAKWAEKASDKPDNVIDHPSHYTNGGMECIDEMVLIFGREATAHFCLCNAWKYRRRALYKNGEEDIQKSHWYIAKYKELMQDG